MTNHLSVLSERIRDEVVRRRIDAAAEPARVRELAAVEVRRYNDARFAAGETSIGDEEAIVRSISSTVGGLGRLQRYLDDPTIEEIWVNGSAAFIARDGVATALDESFSDGELRDLVERMLQRTGRRVDLSQPFADASLPDGSRLHVAMGDVVRDGWSINIRKFITSTRSLAALVVSGMLPGEVAEELSQAMRDGKTVLISGATHAGKTTLLGALLQTCASSTRIVTAEETFELAIDGPDVVNLQGRQANLEGNGEISLRRLVKEALRMRPERLVIGEVRDAEALDLVLALNTGVPGAASIHARSAAEALDKLATLPLLAGRNISRDFLAPAIARSIDYVVHCELQDGKRRVREIVTPTSVTTAGGFETNTIYEVQQ